MAILCAAILLMSLPFNVMAASSPVSHKDYTVSADKTDTAPKTGESDVLLYAVVTALVLSGTAVISGRRLKEMEA